MPVGLIPRFFLHFYDLHFLAEKRVSSFLAHAEAEMNLASRFSILCSACIFLPAASFFESQLCRKVFSQFSPDLFGDTFRLVASNASQDEFVQDKLAQYKGNPYQEETYRNASRRLALPWKRRSRSATADISADWLSALADGRYDELRRRAGPILRQVDDNTWAGIPDRLEGSAFIVDNIKPLLVGDVDLPMNVEAQIHQLINPAYLKSYAVDLEAAVFQEMSWLASHGSVPSGAPEHDIAYAELVRACREEDVLREIYTCEPARLFQLATDERFSAAKAIAAGVRPEDARRTFYTRRPGTSPSRRKRRARELAESAQILIVTALPLERAAVASCLQEREPVGDKSDPIVYEVGTIYAGGDRGRARHVVVASSSMGNNSAAIVATHALRSFPQLRHILMVGIAGGCPNPNDADEHVRLGDVVFSNEAGIVDYGFVKDSGAGREFRRTPQKPSFSLLQAAALLKANEELGETPWEGHISSAGARLQASYKRPGVETDVLHAAGVQVPHPTETARRADAPRVKGGGVAAADILQKDPGARDLLRDRFKVKAIEMESSGLQDAAWATGRDIFVVRGICDYCDEHKNNLWQPYAALAAAAFARSLIEALPDDWFEASR